MKFITTDQLFSDLDTQVNHLMHSFFPTPLRAQAPRFFEPAVDVEETPTAFKLAVDVPGFTKDDIKIEVKDEYLHLSGERKKTVETESTSHVRERVTGRFERSFRLGNAIDWNQVDAKVENGVLEVTLAKAESSRPRTIQIR